MLHNRNNHLITLMISIVFLTGCSYPGAEPQPTTLPAEVVLTAEVTTPPLVMDTAIIAEEPAQPDTSAVFTVTPEPQPTENTNPVLEGETTVLSINMRSGPSTIHDVVGTYNIGTLVTILGQTPDNDWYYVQPRDNNFGWMYATFLKPYVDQNQIPEIIPTSATILHGSVINTVDNSGIDNISIAIVQGSGDEVLRAEVKTMENGAFDAYLPSTMSGTWRVVIVGVGCESVIMGDNCEYTGGFSPDLGITFALPDIPILQFSYSP